MACAFVMLLAVLFALGILNVAANRAVLGSGHPMLGALPAPMIRHRDRTVALIEGAVLAGAMLASAQGLEWLFWTYLCYSALTLASAWAILTGRI